MITIIKTPNEKRNKEGKLLCCDCEHIKGADGGKQLCSIFSRYLLWEG